MSTKTGYILRRFVACLTLFITAYTAVTYSRDQLMALRGYKVQLGIDQRSLVSQLCPTMVKRIISFPAVFRKTAKQNLLSALLLRYSKF